MQIIDKIRSRAGCDSAARRDMDSMRRWDRAVRAVQKNSKEKAHG